MTSKKRYKKQITSLKEVVRMSMVKNKIDKVLFDDLKDECVKFIKLMNQFDVENLKEKKGIGL